METRDFTTGENSASGSCGDLFADVMTETANAGTSKSAAMAVNSTDQAAAVNSTDAADAGRGTRNGATPKGTAVGIKRERLHLRREEASAELREKVSANVSAKAASLRKNVADAVSKARRLQSCGAIEPALAQNVINATRSANAYIRRKERNEGNSPYSTCSAGAIDRADVLNIRFSGQDEAKVIRNDGEANAMSPGFSGSDNSRCTDSSDIEESHCQSKKADANPQVEEASAVGSRAIWDRVAERSLQNFDTHDVAATGKSSGSGEIVDGSSGGSSKTEIISSRTEAESSEAEIESIETPVKRNAELRRRAAEDGIQTLSNEELVSLLLNQSSRYSCLPETAQALLDSNDGSLLGISDRSLKELMMIPGIGIYRGVTIQAIFELGRRLRNEIPRPKPVVISAQSAFELLRTDFQDLNHEESWALFLNRANGLISKERISMGGVSATTLDPRIIVKRAVDLLASSFIIAHNHPSGNMYPGDLDKKMTVALRQAAALFNISLLDHLIIAGNKFFSFSDEGL